MPWRDPFPLSRMQPAPSSGGGPPHGTSPQASAAVRLLAAVQRREDAAAIRARLASLPPPSHDAEWLPWLGNLLHAALDRPDDPGVLTALLSCLVGEPPAILEGGGGGGPSPAGSAAATTPGLSPLLQQLLTSALQRGGPGIVGVVLRHCGGDLDMPLPAFPRCVSVWVSQESPRARTAMCVYDVTCHQSMDLNGSPDNLPPPTPRPPHSGMLAFSCYTGNLRLIAALLDWGADHQRALDLLSPPAAVGIRWDAACVALLQVGGSALGLTMTSVVVNVAWVAAHVV